MSWQPSHGCAVALPRPKKPGVTKQGPKPSPLYRVCSPDPVLLWILWVGGCEAIIDFSLEKAESARHITEHRHWMSLVRSAANQQSALAKQRAEIHALLHPPEPPPLTWEERRKLLIARDNARRAETLPRGIAARVAAAPKPSPLTLQKQRLERTLKATPAMTEPITTTPAKTTHSRKPKGECGVALGKKLDALIAEVQHEAACESSCCAAPVAVIERPPEKTDVVDPPVGDDCGGAVVAKGQPVETAGTGGSAGFTHSATAWDCMAGKAELISDVQDFLKELDESPDLRAAATLRSLSRIRSELNRIPETAALGDPIELRLQDVLVIARQMLARLR